jgi:hypothetical protein
VERRHTGRPYDPLPSKERTHDDSWYPVDIAPRIHNVRERFQLIE